MVTRHIISVPITGIHHLIILISTIQQAFRAWCSFLLLNSTVHSAPKLNKSGNRTSPEAKQVRKRHKFGSQTSPEAELVRKPNKSGSRTCSAGKTALMRFLSLPNPLCKSGHTKFAYKKRSFRPHTKPFKTGQTQAFNRPGKRDRLQTDSQKTFYNQHHAAA